MLNFLLQYYSIISSTGEYMSTYNTNVDRTVVRVKTNTWYDKNGLHIRRDVTYMKRLSSGHNILQNELDNTDATFVKNLIVNVTDVKDGLYYVQLINCVRDFETGFIELYDFKLVPYAKSENVLSNSDINSMIFKELR